MLLLYIFIVAFLAISRPASVQSHSLGKVLAGDDGRTSLQAPLIFYNLTEDEYTAKKLEHHGPPLNKRVALNGESANNAAQQAIVEYWSDLCLRHGWNRRFRHGRCYDAHKMRGYCSVPGDDASLRHQPEVTRTCDRKAKPPVRCATRQVWNYDGVKVRGPYCADVIEVDEEKEEEDFIEIEDEEEKEEEQEEEWETKSPRYDGFKPLPYEAPSPGTWDFFYELTGGDAGHFVYHGNAPDGKKFRSQSPKQSNSWACLGCPSGILHVMTFGLKSEALGFSVPSGK